MDGHANLPDMAAARMMGKGVEVQVADNFLLCTGDQPEYSFVRFGQALAPYFERGERELHGAPNGSRTAKDAV
jgi:hypothetical protein